MTMNRCTGRLFALLAVGLVGCASKRGASEPSDAWWLLPDLGDEDGDDDGGDDDDEDDDDEGEYLEGAVFWGEAFFSGDTLDEGYIGFYIASEDEGLVCELEYVIASASSTSGCDECSEAFELTYGDLEFAEGDESACAEYGWDGLAGTTVKVGSAGSTLWVDAGEGWVAAGESERDGGDWFFQGVVE